MDKDEECFEGFAYDLVAEMAKYNGFKFKFTTNQDYGNMNHKTGKWSGMIGELQSMVSYINIILYAIIRCMSNMYILYLQLTNMNIK